MISVYLLIIDYFELQSLFELFYATMFIHLNHFDNKKLGGRELSGVTTCENHGGQVHLRCQSALCRCSDEQLLPPSGLEEGSRLNIRLHPSGFRCRRLVSGNREETH